MKNQTVQAIRTEDSMTVRDTLDIIMNKLSLVAELFGGYNMIDTFPKRATVGIYQIIDECVDLLEEIDKKIY